MLSIFFVLSETVATVSLSAPPTIDKRTFVDTWHEFLQI